MAIIQEQTYPLKFYLMQNLIYIYFRHFASNEDCNYMDNKYDCQIQASYQQSVGLLHYVNRQLASSANYFKNALQLWQNC